MMTPQDQRSATNPVFGLRKLKLGTFQSNMDSGCVMSALDGRLQISWPNTLALAKLADEMDFEAIVPVARWRGFGGATNPQGPGLETYTWAAGIGAAMTRAGVVSTSHVTINHPIVAAKQSMTIDHITKGRFTLNIVTGWNKPEIDMFGTPMLGHDERYDCAEEWLEVVRKLWSSEEEFDHEGRYYQIRRGYMEPKPIQKPFPAVMNAGGSERGRRFAAQHCDIVYTVLTSTNFDDCKASIKAYRDLAHREFGRDLKVWSLAYIVQARTEAEAKSFYNDYVNVKGDWEAAGNVIDTMGLNAKTIPPERLQAMKERFIAGWSGYPLIGTKDQIVDGLEKLSEMGLDGVLLSWPKYIAGMEEFKRETYPLLLQTGLR
ncbi:LLM class flavin-dependent oxidoreductase [Bradyrhizobium archetypum]|uniref:LLM class flavin-dependent oxidoreductase n=1 Tax=Bradyrhizobium archetypum TaxID=2721160 RepID=A0A7Y4M0S9_9BRAD|nr:LLM class flavin-dependent oxidoreductase [Bradyrhizobium archetypum]NOJ45973.1 LLM class flavin-dependent oxidoreductase [Bradyrhizobium archetypum]